MTEEVMDKFTAPTSGFYRVALSATYYEPTNELETVTNPKWRWWKFWVPKTIQRTKYIISRRAEGSRLVFVKKDEILDIEE